jgi:hypothetical protein
LEINVSKGAWELRADPQLLSDPAMWFSTNNSEEGSMMDVEKID